MSSANTFGTFLETFQLLKPHTDREGGGSERPVPATTPVAESVSVPVRPDIAAALLRAIADLGDREPSFGKVAKQAGLNLTDALDIANRLQTFGLVRFGERADGEKMIQLTESGRDYL
jgi:hypothetical protein